MNETELIMLARKVEHQYNLEKYVSNEMTAINRILDISSKDLAQYLYRIPKHRRNDLNTFLKVVEDYLADTRHNLTTRISVIAGIVSEQSATTHSNIISWDGEAKAITAITLAQEAMAAYWNETPVGGVLLKEWVDKSFDLEMKSRIQAEVKKGVLDGESYPAIEKRLYSGLNATKQQIETLVKTYVQSANTDALSRLYKRNAHIVKSVRWVATFEGGQGSGRGTCIRCASLDGRVFPRETAPTSPLHPRCRCILAPVTDMKKLQLTQEGKEKVIRPYTVWEDGKVTKGKMVILKAGRFKGTLAEWAMDQPEHVLKNMVGPKRLDLLKQGKVKFEDLITKRTHRIKRLDELTA